MRRERQIDALKTGIDQIKVYISNLEQCHANSLTNVNTEEANRWYAAKASWSFGNPTFSGNGQATIK